MKLITNMLKAANKRKTSDNSQTSDQNHLQNKISKVIDIKNDTKGLKPLYFIRNFTKEIKTTEMYVQTIVNLYSKLHLNHQQTI